MHYGIIIKVASYCFKQIDDIAPAVNVTAIQDLLSVGTPAVSLSKSDVGSGVATVDLYLLEG